MNKKTLFKVLGIFLAMGGALVASKSTDLELEELVDKKFNESKEKEYPEDE